MLLFAARGMAFGGWMGGAIYDHFGFYGPAFATGMLFNLVNLVVVAGLVLRQRRRSGSAFAALSGGTRGRPIKDW